MKIVCLHQMKALVLYLIVESIHFLSPFLTISYMPHNRHRGQVFPSLSYYLFLFVIFYLLSQCEDGRHLIIFVVLITLFRMLFESQRTVQVPGNLVLRLE